MSHNIINTFNRKGSFVPDPETPVIAKAKRILRRIYRPVYCRGLVGIQPSTAGRLTKIPFEPEGGLNEYQVGGKIVNRETLLKMARRKA